MMNQATKPHYYSQIQNESYMTQSKTNMNNDVNKTFPIIYNNTTFMVDPNLLMKTSLKFKELIKPHMKDNHCRKAIRLKILGNEFTNRNMDNFLKLAQQSPTDIKNSEMEEICKISTMFQAESVYQKALSIVQKQVNPDFHVSQKKYDGSKRFILIESINHENFDNMEKDNNYKGKVKEQNLENEPKPKSINYRVKIKYQAMKCPIFQFSIDGKILYTAKHQYNHIFIGEGDEVHIKKTISNRVAEITQQHDRTNFIKTNEKEFQLKYNESTKPKHLSLSATFPHKGKNMTLNSKISKKNIVFQNSKGETVLKITKKSYQTYELDTLQSIDPLMIFIISLSAIIGPHDEPFGGF